jgi:hypothetical protein
MFRRDLVALASSRVTRGLEQAGVTTLIVDDDRRDHHIARTMETPHP